VAKTVECFEPTVTGTVALPGLLKTPVPFAGYIAHCEGASNSETTNASSAQTDTRRSPVVKAIEFHSQLNSDQTLTIPDSMRGVISIGQTVRVLILVPEGESDREWEQLAAEEFGQGYTDADAIYDQFSSR
jgi:hypothetical protein